MSGFTELYATACQRILLEWDLTARQQDLCLLLASLTYGAELLTLALPRQQDLAEALGWDAPSLSRVLRSVIALGLVKLELCAGEKLLSLQIFADVTKTRLTPAMHAARQRLRESQQLRDSGRCDANGQMRMPAIIPAESEGPQADALAFRAMVETDLQSPPPRHTAPPASAPLFSPMTLPASRPAHNSPTVLLNDLRSEICRLPTPGPQLKQFHAYYPWWRKQALNHPERLAAAILAHRQRPVPAKVPGGWIKTAMERHGSTTQALLPL